MNLIANFAVLASRRIIFELPVCDLGWEDALAFVRELSSVPIGQTVISFVNAHNMLTLLRDEEYRNILAQNLVLPDGIGLDIASKFAHGIRFPANLNGTDFVPALLTYIDKPMRIGLIGAKGDIVHRAAERFTEHAPWHEFIAISDGYMNDDKAALAIENMAQLDLDILIVAMGTPLQEKWIAGNIRPEHARLVLGVGALFDFVSGTVPRAPLWVRSMRVEWAYRMVQEPRRMWRRYMIGIPVFLFEVLRRRFDPHPRVVVAPVKLDQNSFFRRRERANVPATIPVRVIERRKHSVNGR